MKKSDRRGFIKKGAAAVAAGTVGASELPAQTTSSGKKVWYRGGKAPEKPQLFSPAVSYGNLLFLSGIGAHFEGDIKAHTQKVLDDIESLLKDCGSSMDKVLKAQVYLADLKDYDGMNEVF